MVPELFLLPAHQVLVLLERHAFLLLLGSLLLIEPCDSVHDASPRMAAHRTSTLCTIRETREEAKSAGGSLLPPSSGPTQVGTTPCAAFRATGRPESRVEIAVAL